MSKQVQWRRGTASQNNAFTGANSEITVDTTSRNLRVHDGVKAGGHPTATIDDLSSLATRATIGGGSTASAIKLVTARGGAVPAVGVSLWFIPSAAGVAGATIALDGGSAIACRTVTGVTLPAGYLRSGIPTNAVYDGTNWIVNRQSERGTGWQRSADGTLICDAENNLTPASTSIVQSTWNFPVAFAVGSKPRVAALVDGNSWNGNVVGYPDLSETSGAYIWALSNTQSVLRSKKQSAAPIFEAGFSALVYLSAVGRWY